MRILYGSPANSIDVTPIVISRPLVDRDGTTNIFIPAGEEQRCHYLGFAQPNKPSKIYVEDDFGQSHIFDIYENVILTQKADQQTVDQQTVDQPAEQKDGETVMQLNTFKLIIPSAEESLYHIHESIKSVFKYGSLDEEYPEQMMAIQYIEPHHRVLEIGGNIGRNSCVIGKILRDSKNLLVLESDPENASMLQQNRDACGLKFYVENSAISSVPLVQNHWVTKVPSENEDLNQGWKPIPTLTYPELMDKYKDAFDPSNPFDVLVLDCEGAFYSIVKDFPSVMNGITTVVLENDFIDMEEKQYVHSILAERGLECVYRVGGGWKDYILDFFEVWAKAA
jgi:hypothetical protein